MPEITNQGLPNGMTRCWNTAFPEGSRMYEVHTRPEDIKPKSENHCWALDDLKYKDKPRSEMSDQ